MSVGNGFTLHPNLVEPLAEVVPTMDYLLRIAAHHSPRNTQYIGDKELQVLTGRYSYVTQQQIVTDWYSLMEHLTAAMRELKFLCIGDTSDPSRGARSSHAPSINPELPLALRGELPRTSKDSYGSHNTPRVSSRSHSRIRAKDMEPWTHGRAPTRTLRNMRRVHAACPHLRFEIPLVLRSSVGGENMCIGITLTKSLMFRSRPLRCTQTRLLSRLGNTKA
ncbi:hypothetical protein B0H15DRAFT_853009 [Mycena belliarum]|uniref:Uncharacterized protein n=1 Tax=Mycena belliarum TaxID=1033014 RepID=A0AAD6TWU4_9AGAR|nr:hypothetical protein B0H15DRAFT_853009 [Mycena belliae]